MSQAVKLSDVEPDQLYTPGEVAAIFRVDPKTVVRWIKAGKFRRDEYIRTGGRHHRLTGAGILRVATAPEPADVA